MILFIRSLVSLLVNSTNCSSCLWVAIVKRKNKRNLFRPFFFWAGWLALQSY
jgi:hypothetical protein